MKKSLISFFAIAATLFFFSSCGKEQTTPTEQHTSEPQTYTLTISATKAPSTKSYVLDGTTLNTVWDSNDEVVVLRGNSDEELGRLYPLTSGTSETVLSGSITGTVNVNDWLDLWYGEGLNNQNGTLESLSANHSDRAKAWFQVESIDGSTIVPKEGVSFNNWQAIVKFTIKNGDDDLSISKMVIKAANGNLEGGDGHELTITPSSPSSVLFVAIDNSTLTTDNYEIRVQASDEWYSLPATNKNFERGHYYNVTLKVTKEGSLTRTAAGTPASVFGTEWATNVAANDLSYDAETGNYNVVLPVPGDVTSLKFKVVADHAWDSAWPSDDYEVNDISANGYSKTLTITYNPRNNSISHTLVQNESPYRLYVLQEGLAASTTYKWGTGRGVYCSYDFVSLDDATFGDKTYKCFAIPDILVDGLTEQSLMYWGQNNSKVFIKKTLSTNQTNYYFRTNGILYTEVAEADRANPTVIPGVSTPRIWACATNNSSNQIRMHVWGSANFNTGDWAWDNMKQMTVVDAMYEDRYWFYFDIPSGNTTANYIFVWDGVSSQTDNLEGVSLSSSHYYTVWSGGHLELTW